MKVFTAPTVQEAMVKVKSELGIDAVILHTKRFHKGGFLGYKGKEMVEVTAAIEDAPVPVKPKTLPKESIVPQNVIANYVANANDASIENNQLASVAPINEGDGLPVQKQQAVEENLLMNANDDKRTLEKEQADKIMQLQHELDNMKIMLDKVMSESSKNKVETKSLIDMLRDSEVQDSVAQDIIADIYDEAILADGKSDQTAATLERYFTRNFHAPKEIEISENKCQVVALIGTTGVGKTTTIAKLAAKFVLEKNCDIALITADTYRISAVEQLKTYSDIIGVPLDIVYSPVELKASINKYRDKQLVLIDTAGRSQHNDFQMQELREFLEVDESIQKYLVMSSITRYKDAVDIVRKFSACTPDSVLFTKLDETSSVGMIINLIHQYPIVLSYLTNGQSVPDDICRAQPEQLVKMLLR